MRPDDDDRILIMRLGAIGDVLRVLPALRRIRRERPNAYVGWAVEHWAYPVVAGHPAVDRFHVLDRRALSDPRRALSEVRRFVTEARRQRYRTTLDFHGRLKSGALTRAIGSPLRIGFARGDSTELNHLFTNTHVRLADRWENRVLRFLHLLEPLGMDTRYDPTDHGIHLAPEIRRAARAWYEASRRPALACYPGSSAARARERWPEHKWVDLLRRLARRQVSSVVFWGPAEQGLAARIAAAAGEGCMLAPPTTLPEMMALISCCGAFVGNDTGAMHMAWLQGVPTAAFVGPKPPRTVAPLAPVPSQVLRADEHFREGVRASRQPKELVAAVPVGEAFDAVGALLQESTREEMSNGGA